MTDAKEPSFTKRYGPWALIAGGSEGVGTSFARKFAAEGINLVLVARKPEPLEAAQARAASGLQGRGAHALVRSDRAGRL